MPRMCPCGAHDEDEDDDENDDGTDDDRQRRQADKAKAYTRDYDQ
eukprot:CAMPEP_0117546198 /NCGR_PEP_ID=MMETSP0784-20121206/46485_1 /TAXON_ID=39447 /ORGANISM="" /LENGTH=44 /DNA_ID= /DNA_START= /DNA_END= /DNA_ORIENTATION=